MLRETIKKKKKNTTTTTVKKTRQNKKEKTREHLFKYSDIAQSIDINILIYGNLLFEKVFFSFFFITDNFVVPVIVSAMGCHIDS